ncbi:MAG: hypothetical protein HYU37_05455 [Acidobacteria bacterium]|nr:hypothetical protein [Acidobacteriota bacterium]
MSFVWVALVVAVGLLARAPASAIEPAPFEGAARGFPVLRDLNGARLADGEFSQWNADGRLHVVLTYAFGRGRRTEERVVFRQQPVLVQETWSWVERRGGRDARRFTIDFRSGRVTAVARDEEGELNQWEETFDDIGDGRTFAGFGFTLAIKALRPRLVRGEVIRLQGVGFAPKPRTAAVELSYAGRDRVRMAGRTIASDRFIVHPKLPLLARLFVEVPDATIWLTTPPAGFLRWEGSLAQPDDPLVRVDLLP